MAIHNLNKNEQLNQYIQDLSLKESEELKEIRDKTTSHPCAKMQIPPEEGQFLALMIKILNVQKALEIGIFTGYSSTAIASALPEKGKLFALDHNPEWAKQAQNYWKKFGLEDKIELHLDEAVNSLEKLISEGHKSSFDFIFIDADKKNYEKYYELSLNLLKKGGVIIIDNILWRGYVANPEKVDKPTMTLRKFNEIISNDDRVEQSLLPLWDGISIIRKR